MESSAANVSSGDNVPDVSSIDRICGGVISNIRLCRLAVHSRSCFWYNDLLL